MPFTWDARCLRAYAGDPNVLKAAFALADCDKDGSVSGGDAAKFFRQSGLPDAALSRVWRQSSQGQPVLDLERFKTALTLVASEMEAQAPAQDTSFFLDAPAGAKPNSHSAPSSTAPPSAPAVNAPPRIPAEAETNPYLSSSYPTDTISSSDPTPKPTKDAGANPYENPYTTTTSSFSGPSLPSVSLPTFSLGFGSKDKQKPPAPSQASSYSKHESEAPKSSGRPKYDGSEGGASAAQGEKYNQYARGESYNQYAQEAPVSPQDEEAPSKKKSGFSGWIAGIQERAAEKKMQRKIKKHTGGASAVDVIVESLHKLNHLWLAGYKYEHEKTGKQLAERLLENKHIKLADILEISNVLKANARDVGGTGDDVLSKGVNKIRKGLGGGVNHHPDREKLLKCMLWSFVSMVQTKADFPVASTIRTCVHSFMEENANAPEKAAKCLYMFACKMQSKAQEAEEKRQKELAKAEKKMEQQAEKIKHTRASLEGNKGVPRYEH